MIHHRARGLSWREINFSVGSRRFDKLAAFRVLFVPSPPPTCPAPTRAPTLPPPPLPSPLLLARLYRGITDLGRGSVDSRISFHRNLLSVRSADRGV